MADYSTGPTTRAITVQEAASTIDIAGGFIDANARLLPSGLAPE